MDICLAHVLLHGKPLVSLRLDGFYGDMQARYLVASCIDRVLRPFPNLPFDLILTKLASETL